MTTYRHDVKSEETLEVLETVYQIYKACGLTNSYSGAVGIAVEEFYGKREINMRELLLCMSRQFAKGKLTFPLMLRWKDSGRGIIIKDLICPEDFCINNWKVVPKVAEYVENRLAEAPAVGIVDSPERKGLYLGEEGKVALLTAQERFGLSTIDEALIAILNKSVAMRLVVLLTRLLHNELTVEEAREAFRGFGSFYYVFAYERDNEHIRLVHDFFPYVYSHEVLEVVA